MGMKGDWTMKHILITGALGRIGSELTMKLREVYGSQNVIATDIERKEGPALESGPFELLDVTDREAIKRVAEDYRIDTIVHLAAILSNKAEANPLLAWDINMSGLINALEVARESRCLFFTPSSIDSFGPSTAKDYTPQETIQRPTTMYGINKASGELLCDYYFHKFGVDTRSMRFPGVVSTVTEPGGGITDYAVDIYYGAIENGRYTSYIGPGTYMDMIYLPDLLNAIVDLLEADGSTLTHRNAYNVTGMSVAPEDLSRSIKKYISNFEIAYDIDPVRQAIADSWPDCLDASVAMVEWGFKTDYDLDSMTEDIIHNIRKKLNKEFIIEGTPQEL